jgi:hypothetical protein
MGEQQPKPGYRNVDSYCLRLSVNGSRRGPAVVEIPDN